VADFKPTPKLRWEKRADGLLYLQAWWAPDVPAYMVDPTEGEWRDVPVESASG
jgi:hypothetical protein